MELFNRRFGHKMDIYSSLNLHSHTYIITGDSNEYSLVHHSIFVKSQLLQLIITHSFDIIAIQYTRSPSFLNSPRLI